MNWSWLRICWWERCLRCWWDLFFMLNTYKGWAGCKEGQTCYTSSLNRVFWEEMSVFWGSFKEKIHIIPGLLNGALSIKHQGWYSLRKLEVTSWNQFWKNTFVSFYISVNALQNCPTTVVFAFCHNVYTTWLGHCRLLVTSLFELQTPHFENEDNMYFSCKHTFICLAQDPMGSLFLPSWTSYTRPKHTNKIIQQTRLCQYIWPNRSLCHSPSLKWSCFVLFGPEPRFLVKCLLKLGRADCLEGGSFAGSSVAVVPISLLLGAICFDDRDTA